MSSSAKFCPGCGTAIEDDKPKIQFVAPEKGVDNSTLDESAGNNLTDTDSSIENNLDETEKNAVQTQLTESPSAPEQANNVVVDNANEPKQIETAKSENSATDNIKEVLLPQNRKNGKVKFKDLPKKQKIIRIAIGGGLLLIALIWMISDGISGANKAGISKETTSVNSEKAVISTLEYDNDTGALFDLTLDEFSDIFSDTAIQMTKEISPDAAINEDWNLKDYWSNKADPQTGYEEISKKKYTLYSAFFEGTHITATVIDNKISHVAVGFDYDNNDLAIVYGSVVYTIFSGLDWREAEEKIFQPVRDGIMDNTMIYKDGALFAINVSTITYDVIPASEVFVKSLENAYDSENPPHVIYYGESTTQVLDDTNEITVAVENKNTIDFFGLIDKYISYSGSEGEGEFYLDIPSDDEIEYNGVYFVFTDKKGKESFDYFLWAWEIYNFDVIVDNKKVGTLSVNTGNEQHSFNYLSSGDSVYLAIEESCLEDLEQNNIFFLETEHEYIVPELGSFINSSVDLTEEDIARIKKDALSVGTRTSADSIIRRFNGVTESSETEIYFATIKGSTENEHNAKGFVVVVVPDKDKKQSYVVEFFDVYRQEDGSVTWGSQNSFMSEYHTENEIDKTKAIETYGAYSGVESYSGYTFEKIS